MAIRKRRGSGRGRRFPGVVVDGTDVFDVYRVTRKRWNGVVGAKGRR